MPTKTKKVMLFAPSVSGGGAERVSLCVGQGLADLGYDIDFTIKNDFHSNRFEVPATLNVTSLDAKGLLDTTFKLARRYDEIKPDIVISALETLGLASIAAKRLSRCKPVVVPTVHLALATFYQQIQNAHNRRQKALLKWVYPKADRIVAVSQGAKDELLSFVKMPDPKVTVHYNPVISDETLAQAQSECDHPWIAEGKLVAVAVGRLVPQKNYSLMLKTIAKARKSIDLHLIVLGDGELRDELVHEADALGIGNAVDFHGFVSNPLAFVSNASFYLMSSDWEGLPTVLIEALATSTPIVSTDCPSGPREILDSGRWGMLVPPNDVDLLVEAILRIAKGEGIRPNPEAWSRFWI